MPLVEIVAQCNDLWRLRSKRQQADSAACLSFAIRSGCESMLENYVLFFSWIKRYTILSSGAKRKGTLRCSLAGTCSAVAEAIAQWPQIVEFVLRKLACYHKFIAAFIQNILERSIFCKKYNKKIFFAVKGACCTRERTLAIAPRALANWQHSVPFF